MRKSTDFRTESVFHAKALSIFVPISAQKNAKMLWIIPDPEHFSSVLSLSTHASFTAVPLAMTAGAPSVMLIVA